MIIRSSCQRCGPTGQVIYFIPEIFPIPHPLHRPYDDGFNCDQQDAGYGYYADTLNDCKVGSGLVCRSSSSTNAM